MYNKRTQTRMLGICNTLASGITSYARAAKLNDLSPEQLWNWIKISQKNPDDESLRVDYLGERVPFAIAIHAARRVALHEMRGRMEMKSILGFDEPVLFQGMPTFKPDLRCVGWSEEERLAYGFRADGLFEDENGCVVQNVIHHEPPIALQLRVAEMAFPKEYMPGQNITQNVTHNGVVGIAHAKPVNYSAGPPPVPPAPVPPQLTFAPVPETDAELEDMLALPDPVDDNLVDTVPEPAPVQDAVTDDTFLDEPEPVPVPSAAAALAWASDTRASGSSAGSQLQQELIAKIEAARRNKNPGSETNV